MSTHQRSTTQHQTHTQRQTQAAKVAAPSAQLVAATLLEAPTTLPDTLLSIQRYYGNRAARSIQRKPIQDGELDSNLSNTINRTRGGGQPLPDRVRGSMESAFQSDFGSVRVHNDQQSDTLNHSVQAKAFTLGSDIYFSKGNYQPGSSSGQELLAHELTHVVQQGGGRASGVQTKLTLGPVGDRYEQEADRVAKQVVSGINRPSVQRTSNRLQRDARIIRRAFEAKVGASRWWQNKSKSIIGKTKAGGLKSREESEAAVNMGPADAAAQIAAELSSGKSVLKVFQKVSFLMTGHDPAELEEAFFKHTQRGLRSLIFTTFSGDPGPMAANYLIDILDNKGEPSLKMRAYLAFGQVDGSGTVSRGVAKIPKVGEKIGGEKGDGERVEALFMAATPAERAKLWQDATFKAKMEDVDDKAYDRMQAALDVETAEQAVTTAQTAGQSTGLADLNLAAARDRQLALFLQQCIKDVPLLGTIAKKLGKRVNYGVDSKKFSDYLMKWKSTATATDIAYLKQPVSEFKRALAKVPTNFLFGLDPRAMAFINQYVDQANTQTGEAQTGMTLGLLNQRADKVNRGTQRGYVGAIIMNKITSRKWRDVEDEIKLLNDSQRADLLKSLAPNSTPAEAMTVLANKLMQAGFDKEARARITAMFNTDYGEAGGAYIDLQELFNRGKTSRLSAAASPKKWKDAAGGKIISKSIIKILMDMDSESYVQIRRDTALMDKIKAASGDKEWKKIAWLLGAPESKTDPDNLQTGANTRETIENARVAGEINPKRYAVQLDKALEEDTIGKGVSAGREKSNVHQIVTKARYAAHEFAKSQTAVDERTAALQFMAQIMDGVKALDDNSPRKIEYMQKRIPEAYAVLTNDQPITVATRLARAHREGFALFGADRFRKADRQKVAWSFMDLEGRQLLDEWSNLNEFRALNDLVRAHEKEAVALDLQLQQARGGIMAWDKERRAEIGTLQTQNQAQILMLRGKLRQFTLGISPARLADMKRIGVKAEDRVKYEGLVSDKLIKAMKKDEEVQDVLRKLNVPDDAYMRQKMKAVDALQSQRMLDTTRQWHLFSTKGAQLDDATRSVKGKVTSTEGKLSKVTPATNRDDLEKLRKEGAEQTEKALQDRTMVEAQFRDMQARIRAKAMLIFKLITMAIVMGLSAAFTAGLGTPLAIGIHIGIEAGLQALEAAFRYFVLGDRDMSRLAVDFAIGLVGATTRILTGNLAMALQAEMLFPGAMVEGTQWLAKPISKSISGLMTEMVMFAPKYVVQKVYQDKELEKVIKEGEDNVADAVTDSAVGQLKGFVAKVAIAGLKELKTEVQTGEPSTVPSDRKFNQAYTDRLAGGRNPEEQEQMWGRYEKQQKKAVKKQVIKVLTHKDKETEAAEEDQRKDALKDVRKVKKSPGAKKLFGLIDANLSAFQAAPNQEIGALLSTQKITMGELRGLTEDEQEKAEKKLRLRPGSWPALVNRLPWRRATPNRTVTN